ncbi:hypothetical protein P67b_00061 [Ruegeria phage Tedan]|nr:hypothetical protein P67b_00061 [Ruegeria phage Tedan]
MTRATVRGVNRRIAGRQIEMVKGHGYFYFMPTPDCPLDLDLPEVDSVYTCHITDLTVEQWVAHVEQFFS